MKLRFKILFMCLGCTLIALLLQTWLFQETSSSLIYGQAKEESENSLQNMQNEIYDFAKKMESNLIEVYTEEELIERLSDNPGIETLRSEFYRKAYDIGTSEFETGDNVVALYLYTMDHEIVSTYRRAVTPKHNYQIDIYDDIEGENARIVMDYVESDDSAMLISSYYNPYREKDILRFVLKLYYNSDRNDKVGYIVCDIDTKTITTIMEKYRTDSTVFMWLQPEGDRPALSLGSLSEGEQKYYDETTRKIEKGETVTASDRLKQELFQVKQNKYNLTAYSMMPRNLLEQNQRNLTANLILIAACMIIMATILTLLISRNITRPLDILMGTIQKIKNGNTQLRAEISNKDETGELGKNFNEMLDQMEELKEKEYQAKQLLTQAEYKALQAQINPHFLYNTLDTMSSIAEIKNCPEVSMLSQSLSNLFRYSLNMKEPFSTVAKEIMHLKNYTQVMSIRMHDNIHYIFDVDEQSRRALIPRISLQPLVENAINHGLRNKRGDKEIRIEIKVKADKLHICVADNGVGMEVTEINASLRKNEIGPVEQWTSIGLHNINARLKILYGKQYGIYIESKIGEGTRVHMTLPRNTEERDHV